VELTARLRRHGGAPAIATAAVTTSGRRWARAGFARTWLVNQAVLLGWAAGADVGALAAFYRRAGGGGGGKQAG
jgi:hypothetical protein